MSFDLFVLVCTSTCMAYLYVFDLLLGLQPLAEGGKELFSLNESRSDTEDINVSSCQTKSHMRGKSRFKLTRL